MTLTKEQLIDKLSLRVMGKIRNTLTWQDLVSSVATASNQEKANIIDSLKRKSPNELGNIILKLVEVNVKTKAIADVTLKLENNSLNLTELSEILE
jgi:hypothetical protein